MVLILSFLVGRLCWLFDILILGSGGLFASDCDFVLILGNLRLPSEFSLLLYKGDNYVLTGFGGLLLLKLT